MVNLVLVLGDQLTPDLSALAAADPARDVVVMAEVRDEASYVRHHKKKVAFLFAAMRAFAQELRCAGWTVAYSRYDDPETGPSIASEVLRRATETGASRVLTTECGEWRLREIIEGLPLEVTVLEDTRFISTKAEFAAWAEGRKAFRMEYFYREMRRKTGVLMDGDAPAGEKWNFDHDNRKPAGQDLFLPDAPKAPEGEPTSEVLNLVADAFADHPGGLHPFRFAVTRKGAEAARARFLTHHLPQFGDYQDAMLRDQKWLYHSILGLYINAGLLDPLQTCRLAEAEYRAGRAPINAVEGFVRQILGWREYVRRIYDHEGPDYVRRNALGATAALPAFYWTGDTDMACVKAAVTQTLEEAYAHHIQRLMVTGTFGLLAGVDPYALHEWYLAVYADAYEWVEVPNVVGMSQFADGGLLGSKPYAASGAYIDRMSDHCKTCHYSVKTKAGEGACPFNPLYWDFLIRHREKLGNNPRMAQMYRTWDRMGDDKKDAALTSAAEILDKLGRGARV
ncbi:MAG: cryptochrome/photolyase family protein [Pseudomonadota bacterium]